MITFIKTRNLVKLREEAAKVPALTEEAARYRREAGDARAQAGRLQDGVDYWARQERAARAELDRATARLEAVTEETGRRLGSLIKAAHDPVTGPGIQGQLALQVVRDIIAEAKASGDPAAIEGVRVMDALLGEDWPISDTRPAASLSTAQLRDGANHQDAPGGAHR